MGITFTNLFVVALDADVDQAREIGDLRGLFVGVRQAGACHAALIETGVLDRSLDAAVQVAAFLGEQLTHQLPYLEAFDIRPLTIHKPLAAFSFETDPNAVPLSTIFTYLGISTAYAIAYAIFALSAGMWLFQTRELGGAEG